MKVYVDEKFIPKKCAKCKFIGKYEEGIYSRNPHCCCELIWDLEKTEIKVDKNSRDKRCPLQSLTDYTKQVRKEVCEILDKRIHNYLSNKCRYAESLDVHSIIKQVIKEELDQIQGETNGSKN